jgi:hypothetical protein
MFCAMLGSLFTVLTILLIVQSSRLELYSCNPGKGRSKKASFDNCYSKAVRELVLDNVLISKTARQQNRLFENVQCERFHNPNREGYNPVCEAGRESAGKNSADRMIHTALTGNSHVLHNGVGINSNKYLPYFS